MNRPPDMPEPLLSADATELERRVLRAAQERKPSPASSARMARTLGLTAGVAVTAAAATTIAADAAVAKVGAAVGASTLWPWISVGVLGLVVGGAVVGTRVRHASPVPARSVPTAVTTPAPVAPPPVVSSPPATTVLPSAGTVAPSRRARGVTANSELAEQIAVIDAARSALAEGADRRALEIVRRYQDTYPTGSFRPEATALRIEALVKLGRETEARALAERFVTEHRGTLLAARVAELAGLAAR